MRLLSKIARKSGLVGVYITVVRHSHGGIRVIQSTWPAQHDVRSQLLHYIERSNKKPQHDNLAGCVSFCEDDVTSPHAQSADEKEKDDRKFVWCLITCGVHWIIWILHLDYIKFVLSLISTHATVLASDFAIKLTKIRPGLRMSRFWRIPQVLCGMMDIPWDRRLAAHASHISRSNDKLRYRRIRNCLPSFTQRNYLRPLA